MRFRHQNGIARRVKPVEDRTINIELIAADDNQMPQRLRRCCHQIGPAHGGIARSNISRRPMQPPISYAKKTGGHRPQSLSSEGCFSEWS